MILNALQALSDQEIRVIHEQSLRILQEGGVRVESEFLLDLLRKNGCDVEESRKIACMPRNLVEKCLEGLPNHLAFCDREGRPVFHLGDGVCRISAGHQAIYFLDPESGTARKATKSDNEAMVMVADALPDIDFIATPLTPCDVPDRFAVAYSARSVLSHSTKPLVYASDDPAIHELVLDMDRMILDGRRSPECHHVICELSPTSPLCWSSGPAESLIVAVGAGVPVDIVPAPIAGVTAPYTLAGLLTVSNAEVLSGFVLSQLIHPGHPVLYCGAWTTYDMNRMHVLIGRPESSALRVAGAQMAHFYRVPGHTIGPDTDSSAQDEQNAWEKMLSALAAMLGGTDLLVNAGMFGTGLSASLEQLVVDSEICRAIRRFSRGLAVDAENITVETILGVGPRGNYLMEDHTLDHIRSDEHVDLTISAGAEPSRESANPESACMDRARTIAKAILRSGNRNPLDPSVEEAIEDLFRRHGALPF
jgi:trimethylamine--corrinoid protein Co-methyltransferase